MDSIEAVLAFWFIDTEPGLWWAKDPDFDRLVEQHFGNLLARAVRGECATWRHTPRGRLAEIIALDQFSRNIHRNSPRAYAQDFLALNCAREAVRKGADRYLPSPKKAFLYMPFMHSEDNRVHVEAVKLFSAPGLESSLKSELKHKKIIDRFGRYPHRNAILERVSTPEEIAFLAQSNSYF